MFKQQEAIKFQHIKKCFKKWVYIKNCINEKYLQISNSIILLKKEKLKKDIFNLLNKNAKEKKAEQLYIFNKIIEDLQLQQYNTKDKLILKNSKFLKSSIDYIKYPIY